MALGIIILIAALLIAALLTLSSIAKRVREIGTLRAIGWSRGRVVNQILAEMLGIGIVGAALGVLVGLGVCLAVNTFGPTLAYTTTGVVVGSSSASNLLHAATSAAASVREDRQAAHVDLGADRGGRRRHRHLGRAVGGRRWRMAGVAVVAHHRPPRPRMTPNSGLGILSEGGTMEDETTLVALETPPLYRLRAVERRYLKGTREVAALRGVDLDILGGGSISIEGPSGSGKSTLLQLLGALDTATAGTVQMDGQELGAAGDDVLTGIRSKRIGFVFQQFNLIPTLSASENVALAMVPQHASRPEHDERAKKLLTRVGLGHRLDHLPSRLSGGEQRRVAIAPALADRPEVIVADEPTGNLDSESAGEVLSLLVELQQRDGVSVIVATHDPEVAKHASRHISLRDGLVVQDTA